MVDSGLTRIDLKSSRGDGYYPALTIRIVCPKIVILITTNILIRRIEWDQKTQRGISNK